MLISRFDPDAEFASDERCHIVEVHNRSDDPGCSIARARVAPGVTTRLHALSGIDERYVILEGRGIVHVEPHPPVAVGPLDVVCIPRGMAQAITNAGAADLVFLCVCTPRFRDDAYGDRGEVRRTGR